MASITPEEGLDWYRDRALSVSATDDEVVYDIGVGTGSAGLSSSDTQLDTLAYRGNTDDSTVSIESTSNIGEYEVRISVSGGTEVPAETDITEIGVWARDPSLPDGDFDASGSVDDANDVLLYRELRGAVTLESGDRKTFSANITIQDT